MSINLVESQSAPDSPVSIMENRELGVCRSDQHASLTPAPAQLSEAAERVRVEVREFLAAELAAWSFTTRVDTCLSGFDPVFPGCSATAAGCA